MPRRPAPYYPDYGPFLVTTGADWCWRRAEEIVEAGRHASLRRDGPDIVRAIRFIRASRKGVMGRQMKRLLKKDPHLTMAVKLATEDSRRPLELRCRILARQSPAEIAVEMGLTKPIVETYCKMFFDVRDRLTAVNYIHQRVIGLVPLVCRSIEQLMMLSTYYHGPHVVGPWLDYLDHQGELHDLQTKEGRTRESIELFIAAQQLDDDAETSQNAFKRARFLLETREEMFRSVSAATVLGERTAKMLSNLAPVVKEAPKTAYANEERAAKSASVRPSIGQTA